MLFRVASQLKIWLLFTFGGRGRGGVVEDMLNNFSQQFLRSIKTKCKKNETKQILDLAHLIGKASTDAISKQVRLYWLDLLC